MWATHSRRSWFAESNDVGDTNDMRLLTANLRANMEMYVAMRCPQPCQTACPGEQSRLQRRHLIVVQYAAQITNNKKLIERTVIAVLRG